ncbi:MAG: hypothetical protein U9N34_05365 [Candidatus Cloacimonadota bacterium]|nr:hypothetical protein [Candidatus Cloacimonadota bacterium]
MKKCLTIMFVLIISISLFGENKTRLKYQDYIKFKNGLGLSYSNMTGSGISYYRQFGEKFQIKTTNLFYYSKKDDYTRTIVFIGSEVNNFFYSSDYFRSYFLTGFAYSIDEDTKEDEFDRKIHFGIGLGLEIFSTEHIRLNIDIGYDYDKSIEYNNEKLGLGVGVAARFVY